MKKSAWKVVFAFTMLVLLTGLSARADDEMRMQYKTGDGLKVGDGKSLIGIQGRLQGRYTYNALDGATDNDSFAVQRGKIKIEGFTFDKKLLFGFQMNLATRARATTAAVCTNAGCTTTANAVTAESTTGLATLEDYYFDWVPSKLFGIKGGQYKVPFLIQELTSSGKQQFVDRSLSTGFFNLARDLGLTIHGEIPGTSLNYALFAMNGDGVNTINRNRGIMTGARFELPILGHYGYSESDTDNSEEHNLGVGLAYAYNEAVGATQNGTVAAGTKASHGTFDIGYKHRGWSVQTAGMLTRTMEGAELTNWGYNAQVGRFLIPKKLEIAGRASGTVFSDAVVNQYEYATALNYFIAGHGIKLQTDYGFILNNRGANLNDHRVRTQMQVIF